MYRLIRYAVTLALIGFFATVDAQSVVLINGVPTQVTLDNEEITSVNGTVDGYMSGFEDRPDSEFTNVAPLEYNMANSTPIDLSDDMFTDVSGNYLKFRTNSAILSKLALSEIKDYTGKVKGGEAKSILLESFYLEVEADDKRLASNRVEACRRMFELEGINKSLIVTKIEPASSKTNKVKITLQ